MEALHPDVAAWSAATHGAPSPPQRALWAAPVGHALVTAPTGSGKTLAAFLPALSRILGRADAGDLGDGIQCLYVSPLRALNVDVARALRAAVEGAAEACRARGAIPPAIRVGVRSGDTSEAERRRQSEAPPHVLVTTPETLAILLNAPRLSRALARVGDVVVDEVHALAPTRRGSHLALSLERLERLVVETGRPPPRRVGLSATVAEPAAVARFLCGDRPCALVDAPVTRPLELEVVAPFDVLRAPWTEREDALYALLHERIQRYASTLVFTNTRRLAEEVAAGLRARHPDYAHALELDDAIDPEFEAETPPDAIAPHHGSLSADTRALVEARLKRGDLRCAVTSASLELGIDVGHVEHVVLLGSPRDAARALQRIGRSGHGMGRVRSATLVPLDPEDLLECVALAQLVAEGALDALPPAPPALDVLAQHLVGLALERPIALGEALRLVRRAGPYAVIDERDVARAVDALVAERLLARDARGRLAPGPAGTRRRYATNVGAIVGGDQVRVRHGERYVGDLEAAFARTLGEGDVFQLGGEPWRFLRASGGTVWATPAPGEAPTVPRWGAEGIGAGGRVLERTMYVDERLWLNRHGEDVTKEAEGVVRPGKTKQTNAIHVTDATLERLRACRQLQRAWVGPRRPGEVMVEGFVDDEGNRVTVFHAGLGRRANEALARALSAQRPGARVRVGDRGFALVTRRGEPHAHKDLATLRPEDVGPLALEALESGDRFARRLAHVAQRFLLARDARGPEAARLLRAARELDAVVAEARRDALEDALDVPRASAFVRELREGVIALRPLRKLPTMSLDAFAILYAGERAPSRAHAEALLDVVSRIEDARVATR